MDSHCPDTPTFGPGCRVRRVPHPAIVDTAWEDDDEGTVHKQTPDTQTNRQSLVEWDCGARSWHPDSDLALVPA